MLRKRIVSSILTLAMSFNILTTTYASTYIDSIVTEQTVASGITYSQIEQLTSAGFVDVYLLTMDLTNPNVDFDILRNSSQFGVPQTLTNLVGDTSQTNVVGAVNGSFFFTDTNPTDAIGYEYEDGEFTFMKEGYNKTKFDENSIVISEDNEVIFDYLQANTILSNSKGDSVRLTTLNGERDLIHLTLITDTMMKDTTQVENLGNVYKWVIQDGYVTDIVEPKVVAQVPENGYVLTVNYNAGAEMKQKFPIGEPVNIQLTTNFDDILDNTKLIMSAGGTLLKDGQVQLDGLSVSPNSRQPRTCVGVSQDGNTMYIMAVDGRGDSVGMTNKEAAEFLLSVGAYNAVSLDGGGSTTFAVREEGETQAEVVNNPSDGSERKVINGLGVTTSPTGELAKLKVTPSSDKVLVGQPVTFDVLGLDANDNPIEIDTNNVVFTDTSKVDSQGSTGSLTFDESGIKVVQASYNGVVGEAMVDVYGLNDVNYDIEPISIGLNESQTINMNATTAEGYKIPVDASKYTFTPNANFTVANGTVTGNGIKTEGTITTIIGDKTVTGKVGVGQGDVYIPITSFEGATVTPRLYPNGDEGATGVYKENALDGQSAIKTSFNFKANGKPQAVYSILDNVKITDSRAEKLCVNYYGNNTKNSVKAQLEDAEGNEEIVVFTDSVDFNGYQRLEADMPDGMVYPVTVERLYVASTGSSAISGTGYFDYLTYTIGDKFNATTNNINLSYDELLNKGNVEKMFTVSSKKDNTITNSFTTQVLDNTKVINVSSENGSIVETNVDYYNRLKNELYNSSQKNIVIVTQQSLLENTFSIYQEGIMLRNMLEKYADTYDKNIYFVNNHSNKNSTTYENKIRYIDLYNKDVAFGLDADGNLEYNSIN